MVRLNETRGRLHRLHALCTCSTGQVGETLGCIGTHLRLHISLTTSNIFSWNQTVFARELLLCLSFMICDCIPVSNQKTLHQSARGVWYRGCLGTTTCFYNLRHLNTTSRKAEITFAFSTEPDNHFTACTCNGSSSHVSIESPRSSAQTFASVQPELRRWVLCSFMDSCYSIGHSFTRMV